MADDRAKEALDHLQTAALELIAAFRAVLDVAEEAVREPQAVRDLVSATAKAMSQAAANATAQASGQGAGQAGGVGRDTDGGVEHIRIS
jgi:hypothetical protein